MSYLSEDAYAHWRLSFVFCGVVLIMALSGCGDKDEEIPGWICQPECGPGHECIDNECVIDADFCDPPCDHQYECRYNECVLPQDFCDPPCDYGYDCVDNECVVRSDFCDPPCSHGDECIDNECVINPNHCDPSCDEGFVCIDNECRTPSGNPIRTLAFNVGEPELVVRAAAPVLVKRASPAAEKLGVPKDGMQYKDNEDSNEDSGEGREEGDSEDAGTTGDDPNEDQGDQGDENEEAGDDSEHYSNLIGIDIDGNAWPVVISDYGPVHVDIVVPSPDGESLFLVIPWQNTGMDSALGSCRFFHVPVRPQADEPPFRCVSPHWKLVYGHGSHGAHLAGERKPIHFDDEGRLFFLARDLEHRTALLRLDPMDPEEIEDGYPEELISSLGRLVRITDSVQSPDDFFITNTGVPVWTGGTDAGGGWFLKAGLPEGGEVTLSSRQVHFYGADSFDSIMWGPRDGDSCRGVRFARLSLGGGFTTRCFSTHRYLDRPHHLTLANDGFFYAVVLQNPMYVGTNNAIQMFRIMPANPEPIVTIVFDDSSYPDIPSFISRGNLQISHQHVFFIEEVNDASFGLRNELRAIRVDTQQEKRLFEDRRLEIYRFKVVGDTMYIAGRDLQRQEAVLLQVDMAGLMRDKPEEEIVLETSLVDAAVEARNIRDMTVIRPQVPETPIGVDPRLMDIHFDKDEPQVSTLSFSVPVDESSVEQAISIKDSEDNKLETFGVWGFANMHVLPGTPSDPLEGETALNWGEEYALSLGSGAFDRWDNPISQRDATLRPREAVHFSLKLSDEKPYGQPDTLRFVMDPGTYEMYGPTEEIEYFHLPAFKETEGVFGVEIGATVRFFLPHLMFDYLPPAPHGGFAFEMLFPDWDECFEEPYPDEMDCDWQGFCGPERVLGLGWENSVGVDVGRQNDPCMKDGYEYRLGHVNELREFYRFRARRFSGSMILEKYDSDAPESDVAAILYENHSRRDTALKRANPILRIQAGATVEFSELEIWPLDITGERIGDVPIILFNAGNSRGYPKEGQQLIDSLGIEYIGSLESD